MSRGPFPSTVVSSRRFRLTTLVADLQELAALERRDDRLRPVPLEAGELIRTALEEIRPEADRRNLRLETTVDGNDPRLVGDRARLGGDTALQKRRRLGDGGLGVHGL